MTRRFWILSGILFAAAGCKTGGSQSSALRDSQDGTLTAAAADFETVTAHRFDEILDDDTNPVDPEFLGCRCVEESGAWSPYRFLALGDSGYRAELKQGFSAPDILSCISVRESEQAVCGGSL